MSLCPERVRLKKVQEDQHICSLKQIILKINFENISLFNHFPPSNVIMLLAYSGVRGNERE